jgi:hypothetical protein
MMKRKKMKVDASLGADIIAVPLGGGGGALLARPEPML